MHNGRFLSSRDTAIEYLDEPDIARYNHNHCMEFVEDEIVIEIVEIVGSWSFPGEENGVWNVDSSGTNSREAVYFEPNVTEEAVGDATQEEKNVNASSFQCLWRPSPATETQPTG